MATAPLALRLSAALLLAALAGCGGPPQASAVGASAAAPGGPPWVTAVSPDMIALRWYPRQIAARAAERVAQAHCAASGKAAVLVSDQHLSGAHLAQYDCR